MITIVSFLEDKEQFEIQLTNHVFYDDIVPDAIDSTKTIHFEFVKKSTMDYLNESMNAIDQWQVSNQEKIDYFLNFFRHFDKVSPFIDESNVEWMNDYSDDDTFKEGFHHLENKLAHGIKYAFEGSSYFLYDRMTISV